MRLITLPLLVLLTILPGLASAQSLNIAVVDLQTALNSCEQGKRAKANLEIQMETASKELEKEKGALEQMRDELEAQAVMLSETALREKEAAFNQRAMAFQQAALQQQQQLALLEQELTGDILLKLANVAEQVGKEKGYTLILEKSAVIFQTGGLDITDEVITRFNNKGK